VVVVDLLVSKVVVVALLVLTTVDVEVL